ncbi:MAG: dehydrogenase [Bacilli bacterium]|nr:dehydrogenase [Bacilli bacterium]
MKNYTNEKHNQTYPSLRNIRRACQRELYRTVKKLNKYISPDIMKQAEQIYLQKVVLNLPWIAENGSNRKLLANWWKDNVCDEIAVLWSVEPSTLAIAFRDSFS